MEIPADPGILTGPHSYVLGLSEYAATTEHKIPLGDRYSELDPAQISA